MRNHALAYSPALSGEAYSWVPNLPARIKALGISTCLILIWLALFYNHMGIITPTGLPHAICARGTCCPPGVHWINLIFPLSGIYECVAASTSMKKKLSSCSLFYLSLVEN